MKLIDRQIGLSPKGLQIYFQNNNHFVESSNYKIVIKSYRDCWTWFNVFIYEYAKKR